MNKTTIFFLLFLVGCQVGVPDIAEIMPEEQVDEVRSVLEEELFTPPGKLKSALTYQGRFVERTDYYYRSDENVKITLFLNESGTDTASVKLYLYDEQDKLIQKKYFKLRSGGDYFLRNILNYQYDASGRLHLITNRENREIFRHHYNDDGQLIKTDIGGDINGEFYLFEYDDQNRISRRQWMGGESPIMEYFYRYNAKGLLEAKEAGAPIQVREDAFKFYYNQKDQLIHEEEFYPQWDFVLWFERFYEYY